MIQPTEIGALFDLDGVLLDTEGSYSRLWSGIDRKYPTGVPDFATVIKGSNLENILNSYFPAAVHADVVRMLDEFQATMEYRFFDGALKWLDSLASAGIAMCLVTSSDRRKMDAVYRQHPTFKNYFAHVITGDMVSHPKPAPECFLTGARLLGKDIKRCVVFEDSLNGLRAARSAGAAVVGLATTCKSEVIAPLCDLTVSDISVLTVEQVLNLIHP